MAGEPVGIKAAWGGKMQSLVCGVLLAGVALCKTGGEAIESLCADTGMLKEKGE